MLALVHSKRRTNLEPLQGGYFVETCIQILQVLRKKHDKLTKTARVSGSLESSLRKIVWGANHVSEIIQSRQLVEAHHQSSQPIHALQLL